MTQRDRILLLVLGVCALLAGFWFGVLAPKREEARTLADQVAQQQRRLDAARQSAASALQAKARYDRDYAAVARLGKAVPADDDVPSLVFQLERAADGAHVDFRAFKATAGPDASAAATSGVGAVAQAGAAVKSNGASPDAAAPAATQATAATLPPGATVGPAGFPTMPFSFAFQGSFFDMQRLLRNVQRLVTVRGERIRVDGRLMTIDGFALQAGDKGFPQVKAALTATAYLVPADEGATGGATAQGPATPATATPTTTASSSSGGGSATTTATATGVK